jgi:isoleucyl-tRNA synthetase
VIDLFAKSGADAWYTPQADSLAEGAKCPCGGSSFQREADILDVWFESGCSYLAMTASEPDYPWPSDLYLEGGDQHRGWFQSSLLCSVGARGSASYKGCVTPGWTLDEQGRALSKSRGNDVDPVDIANRLGAEIVRLWVASVDFREDVVGSENLMQRIADVYRDIRNKLFRNSLGNLYDFDPATHALPFSELHPLDQYMLRETAALADDVRRWYEQFAFHKIYQRINTFCIVELSAFYFDVIKDRLYIAGVNSRGRRSAQTTIWHILEALVRLLAPIVSFTCDEVWQLLPKVQERPESVHMSVFPTSAEILKGASEPDKNEIDDWTTLHSVREQVLKSLEEARNQKLIGKALEAQVKLTASESLYEVLERHQDDLRYLFIVSQVKLERAASGNGTAGLTVEVSKADGAKCERCWNYSTHVGEDAEYPTVCERCAVVLKELEATGNSASSN